MDNQDMIALTARTEKLVGAISGAILGTVEVAAERISLAAEVARVSQRLSAFSSVLEAVGAQKDALAGRLAGAKGAMRALLLRQVEMLTVQETAILEKAGAPPVAARAAVDAADAPVYKRVGSRFQAVNGAVGNGAGGGA